MKWIDVKKQLPIYHDEYLIYCQGFFELATYDVDNKLWWQNEEYPLEDVTHWTTLPIAPMTERDKTNDANWDIGTKETP